ncbi:metal-dependent phosphohydrolase HD sub domain protein [Planctopirus limnophila DSM 3776]|uniref:Metal-dependent phosphohydrolase HD sub domain protein n=1 Tax=Planctopirus limnophila (strain ATCC 43296 / DSM 3776 / IFAM 1008 / Mu 290) TaxID=521674 RepID=D5SU82_PLAL2|nr:HD domain-containing protein [Planctopirus limnophila]ADG69135.1 metal-dependent phosphohydrolase HD sub domain protein [Planctopirus limnophila DSM 3776]
MSRNFISESLSHDPIHGYIPFISRGGLPAGETAEQDIIDHPWVQRLRHIHQLQTAWWVFPAAEHMRFQHVMGAMHLASVAIDYWYDSLCDACRNVPSRPYVESLLRMAALLHDVGHGPFGHFFDDHYLAQFGVTHEDVGGVIIEQELGELLRGIRRNPKGELKPLEELDPRQISWLIRRPRPGSPDDEGHPDWLKKLRAMFSGIYTVDNMDFVLRDAYMTGYNVRAFDISRLLHYSFFTPQGLTIHIRGLPTLINFIETRANLFRTVYFHRTVRAIDLALEDLFPETMPHLFQGSPIGQLENYRRLTESSFLVDVDRFSQSTDPATRQLGERWQKILSREVHWKMATERTMGYYTSSAERMSIFSEPDLIEQRLRGRLPEDKKSIEMRIDVARHYHRPSGRLPVGGQNHLFDPAANGITELSDDELFRQLPLSLSVFRVYSRDHANDKAITMALQSLLGDAGDAKTNM